MSRLRCDGFNGPTRNGPASRLPTWRPPIITGMRIFGRPVGQENWVGRPVCEASRSVASSEAWQRWPQRAPTQPVTRNSEGTGVLGVSLAGSSVRGSPVAQPNATCCRRTASDSASCCQMSIGPACEGSTDGAIIWTASASAWAAMIIQRGAVEVGGPVG